MRQIVVVHEETPVEVQPPEVQPPVVQAPVVQAPVVQAPVEDVAPSKLKRVAIFGGIGLLLLGVAYGAGRLQTSRSIDAADERTAEALYAKGAVERTLSEERAMVRRLEARRLLHQALLALEQRNFGITQELVADAGKLLDGDTQPEVSQISVALSEFRLEATENLGEQQKRLLDLTQRFDKAVPTKVSK